MADLNGDYSRELIEMKYLELEATLSQARTGLFNLKKNRINLRKKLSEIEGSVPISEEQILVQEQELAEYRQQNNI